ncbi:MAG: BamA/TamA family outer membrane protein [Thermonemataceae bacterium]|nr:BamA/TamA family outer membrane protein [Thermonemataceae bacterium]
MCKKNLFLIFFWLISQGAFSQKKLYILFTDEQSKVYYQENFPDSTLRENYLLSFSENLQKKGYWYHQILQKKYTKDSLIINWRLGEPVRWRALRSNIEPSFLKNIYLQRFTNHIFDWYEIEKIQNKILENLNNQGYPFAKLYLDSLRFDAEGIEARLALEKGFLVVWDTLSWNGDVRLRKKFLLKYLPIKPNELYSETQIQKSERLLLNLGFLKLSKASEVRFEAQKAKVIFHLKQNRSNEIDGILGLMPNELAPQTLLLTGQFRLHLRNLFGAAKSLALEFQQLKPNYQLLNANYKHPIFLGTKLGVEADFKLLREDTNFVNIQRVLRFTYPKGYAQWKIFAGIQTNQTGYTPKNTISELPPNQESRYTFYGLGYEWNKLDDIFLPKNGWFVGATIQTGNKSISPLPFLPDSLYRNVELESLQTTLETKMQFYKMLHAKNAFLVQLSGATLLNTNILEGELYRLGGLTSIRGFNQNFFYASSYLASTLEYRFFWEEEAYFSLFYDQAFLEKKVLESYNQEKPFGLGLGLSFRTKGGIFNLSIASGKSDNQDFSISRAKIHFGFVSRF